MKRFLIGGLLTIAVQGIDLLICYGFTKQIEILPLVLVFLLIFGISAWEMRLLTRKTSNIRDFVKDYVPFLIQTVCILAADIVLCTMMTQIPMLVKLIAYAAAELCCALTVFLIGAASTVLYRKS